MEKTKKHIAVITMLVVAVVFTLTNSFAPAHADTAKRDVLKLKTQSVVVYCRDTNQVIYEKNPDKKIDPFSTTKVMTSLLACENLDKNKMVTASTEAASIGDSSMGLLPGERVTVEQLIYGALLPSGNDAAYVLGEEMGGTIPKFSKMMNDRAKKIGCKNTHFVNPNGLMEKGHYSTAMDMMLIFNEALNNNEFVKIAGTKSYNLPATNKKEPVVLHNTCKVMKENKKVFAAKTGSWDFENSLVFAFKDKGLTFVVSMMKSNIDVRDIEAQRIIDYVSKDIDKVTIEKKGIEVGKCRLKDGNVGKVRGELACDAVVFLPDKANRDLIKTKAVFDKEIKAPIKQNQKIGSFKMYLDDKEVASVPIIAQKAVKRGLLGLSNKTWILIAVLIVIAVLAIIKKRKIDRRKKIILQKALQQLKKEGKL